MRRYPSLAVGIAALALTANSPGSRQRSACDLAAQDRRSYQVHVPFTAIDGRIYVEAKVNGRGPYIFAVDTGASGVGRADSALVAALDLPFGEDSATSDGIRESKVRTVRIETLQLGGLSRNNQQIITRDYRSRLSPEAAFAGILGREFFADGLLIIDYGRKTISFTRKLALNRLMPGALPYERAFRVPVTISGIATQGNLDTGANVELVLPLALYRRISSAAVAQDDTGQMTNSTIRTGRAVLDGPITLGGVSASRVPVKVSEQFPEVLVGAHFLQRSVVMIDQRSRTVAVCPLR